MKLYSNDGGLLIITILLWVFLVDGDPDVWDVLRAYLMGLS